jgi:pimeloyl-ACP methyl ester carboxylesterase
MTGDFSGIRCPTLVLAGRHDGLRPPAAVEPVPRAIAGARFQVLETAHFMSWQAPAAVTKVLSEFLATADW